MTSDKAQPALVVFDLDGTLAQSKRAVDPEMAALLVRLVSVVRVAVISGGAWPQFEQQLLGGLPGGDWLKRVSLMPTCGAEFYRYEGVWTRVYSERFTEAERDHIIAALHKALEVCAFDIPQIWGPQIEDRGGQITYSALGQHAPIEAKSLWDPDMVKRRKLVEVLGPMIPDAFARLGGATSIDVTRPGIDKAYGLRQLEALLDTPCERMIFVGDALFPGGNDYPAISTGARPIAVHDPEQTKRVIEAICACLE